MPSPQRASRLWRGVFLADISDPASPKITLAERGALLSESPEKVRFHLEDGTQQELVPKAKGPVLDYDVREHRHSHRAAVCRRTTAPATCFR